MNEELDGQKRVIIRREGVKWIVKFKGDFISGRDFLHLKRSLDVAYRSYLRSRAVARRKGAENATV